MDDEPEEMGIPEWVVTFGDMMSLLLTFFIMLVSLSEIKEEETYQALVDSMQRQFGYARTLEALTPGEQRPRSSAFTTLATTGRAKKKDTAPGRKCVSFGLGSRRRSDRFCFLKSARTRSVNQRTRSSRNSPVSFAANRKRLRCAATCPLNMPRAPPAPTRP